MSQPYPRENKHWRILPSELEGSRYGLLSPAAVSLHFQCETQHFGSEAEHGTEEDFAPNSNLSLDAPCLNLLRSSSSAWLQRELQGIGFPQGGAPVNHLTHLLQKRTVLKSFPTTRQVLFTSLLCVTKKKKAPLWEWTREQMQKTKTGLLNHTHSCI